MPDQQIDVPFPLAGVDVAHAFRDQPTQTCVVGLNVRATDPLLERNRGGSRHGLVKYVSEQIPDGTVPFQFLGQLIILDAALLPASFVWFDPSFVSDPTVGPRSNPNFMFPPTGSGNAPGLGYPLASRRQVTLVAT